MPRQSKGQRETVGRVMHEFKHGELDRRRGGKVKSRKQAVAIALHEAGASKHESPRKNRENLRKTKARERHGQTRHVRRAADKRGRRRASQTRAELYREARSRDIPGRSRMSKADLERALRR